MPNRFGDVLFLMHVPPIKRQQKHETRGPTYMVT